MRCVLQLAAEELLLALLQVAREALVELLAALDRERVRDRLACELAEDVGSDVQPENSR